MTTDVSSQPTASRCPVCGARLKVNPVRALAGPCPACASPLVSAEGDTKISLAGGQEATAHGCVSGLLARAPVVVFCGAGVSMPGPTFAPSWDRLAREVLAAVFAAAPVALPELDFARDTRRPEQILDTLGTVLGDDFPVVFQQLDQAAPNSAHTTLANLAKAGRIAALVTTNFDRYLERALEAGGLTPLVLADDARARDYLTDDPLHQAGTTTIPVLKLHGSVEDPASIVSVASRYRAGGGALGGARGDLLASWLQAHPMLVLGYSGRDFEHPDYRAYWDAVGPQAPHGVLWSQHPSEPTGAEGVDLEGVFASLAGPFTRVVGELPDLIERAARIRGVGEGPAHADAAETDVFDNSNAARRVAFRAWAEALPAPHRVAIGLIDAGTFSKAMMDRRDRWLGLIEGEGDDKALDMAAAMEAMTATMTELAERMQAGEIDYVAYMEEMINAQLDNLLTFTLQTRDPAVRGAVEDAVRAIPEPQRQQRYLGILQSIAAYVAPEEVVGLANTTFAQAEALDADDSKEGQLRQSVLIQAGALHALEEGLRAEVEAEIEALIAARVADEIDDGAFHTQLQERFTRVSRVAIGMPDADRLVDELARTAAAWPDAEEALEAVEQALTRGPWQIAGVLQTTPEAQALQAALADEGRPVDPAVLAAYDDRLERPLTPLRDRLDEVGARRIEVALLVSILAAHEWNGDGTAELPLTVSRSTGAFPRRRLHPALLAHLCERFEPVWTARETLPAHMQQALCGVAGRLADARDDRELAEAATAHALALAGGRMAGTIHEPVPEAAAALAEAAGDTASAIQHYTLALDALELAMPRMFLDAVAWRLFELHRATGDDEAALGVARRFMSVMRYGGWDRQSHHHRLLEAGDALAADRGQPPVSRAANAEVATTTEAAGG